MNEKQLEMILAIEKFSNISKAADYLGITQATLSKFLANTEKKFESKIFYRYSRKVTPTEEGEIILNACRTILKEYENIRYSLHSLRNDGLDEIRLGTHQVLGKFIIPKMEAELNEDNKIILHYTFKNSRQVTEDITNGIVDLGIVADPQRYPDLIIKPLWKEHIGLYSLDGEMKDDILYNSNMIFANKFLNQVDFKQKKKVDDYGLIYSVLKRSNQMGLLPNPIAESQMKLKLIKKFSPNISICLVYNSSKVKSKAFKKVVKTIIECAKK